MPWVDEPALLDWRYCFYRNGIADSSCLLARQYLSHCMRNDVGMTDFQTGEWRKAMAAAGPDNPSVLGFFTEQVLLGEIARSGLSALGKGWEEMSLQALSDGIPTLPREAKKQAIMYVPTKLNNGIDVLFFKLVSEPRKRGRFKATVVPTQITIAESHSDSEAGVLLTWPRYELELRSLGFVSSIEIIFLWIVEQIPAGHQPEEAEPKGTRTLKGDATDHPGFVRRWMRIDEASTVVGDLLNTVRGRPTVATVRVVLPASSSSAQTPAAHVASVPASGPSPSTSAPVANRRPNRAQKSPLTPLESVVTFLNTITP